jgi:GAF domain-containing protein
MPPTDAQQRIAELTTLNALAQTLNRSSDLREALESALTHIVELMGLSTGWIFLTGEGEGFSLAARHNLPPAIVYPGPAWEDDCDCQELCGSGKLEKAVNMVRCSRRRATSWARRSRARGSTSRPRCGACRSSAPCSRSRRTC